jgi:ribosomal protein S18 acetylase RimI-like enzyme
MSELELRKATAEDVPVLSRVLARAFADDPFYQWMMRRDRKRETYAHLFHETALRRISLPEDEVYTTTALHGAALWAPPGAWKMGLWQELALFPQIVRCTGASRILQVLSGTNRILAHHPRAPHYYLFILGVDPSAQGRGVGRALLRPILERCDRERQPAYLETTKESNIAFYQACGFKVTGEITVPYDGPKIWFMWRDPA